MIRIAVCVAELADLENIASTIQEHLSSAVSIQTFLFVLFEGIRRSSFRYSVPWHCGEHSKWICDCTKAAQLQEFSAYNLCCQEQQIQYKRLWPCFSIFIEALSGKGSYRSTWCGYRRSEVPSTFLQIWWDAVLYSVLQHNIYWKLRSFFHHPHRYVCVCCSTNFNRTAAAASAFLFFLSA